MENSITLYFILRKKLRLTLQPQIVDFLNLPIVRMGTWDSCLMDFPPLAICNDECWKWSVYFTIIDGWDGTKVLVLDWMQVMPCDNVGS
jgi:hypothetical protein